MTNTKKQPQTNSTKKSFVETAGTGTIFRSNPDTNYTVMSNAVRDMHDSNATGILFHMISQPADFQLYKTQLQEWYSISTVNNAFKKLHEHGYLFTVHSRNGRKKLNLYFVSDKPFTEEEFYAHIEKVNVKIENITAPLFDFDLQHIQNLQKARLLEESRKALLQVQSDNPSNSTVVEQRVQSNLSLQNKKIKNNNISEKEILSFPETNETKEEVSENQNNKFDISKITMDDIVSGIPAYKENEEIDIPKQEIKRNEFLDESNVEIDLTPKEIDVTATAEEVPENLKAFTSYERKVLMDYHDDNALGDYAKQGIFNKCLAEVNQTLLNGFKPEKGNLAYAIGSLKNALKNLDNKANETIKPLTTDEEKAYYRNVKQAIPTALTSFNWLEIK